MAPNPGLQHIGFMWKEGEGEGGVRGGGVRRTMVVLMRQRRRRKRRRRTTTRRKSGRCGVPHGPYLGDSRPAGGGGISTYHLRPCRGEGG
eukprot:6272325-Pyramimonas_sp.AAC.1